MERVALWLEIASVVCVFLVQSLPIGFQFRRRRRVPWMFGLLVFIGVAGAFGVQRAVVLVGAILVAASLIVLANGWRESQRFQAAWLKRFQSAEPVILSAPFEGSWKALGTGPSVARNHHLAAQDQWFATDFVRVNGESRGSRILAPVDGVVAYLEDGHRDKPARRWIQKDLASPAGNHVSLRIDGREDDFVILAHLEQGSITVHVGERVRAGDLIARCGNSGNTTVPHLHIHAQPAERFVPGSVWGVPVLFATRAQWLSPGEIVSGA